MGKIITKGVFFFLLLKKIWSEIFYVGNTSSDCAISNSCDGSVFKPYSDVYSALERIQNQNTADFSLNFLEETTSFKNIFL